MWRPSEPQPAKVTPEQFSQALDVRNGFLFQRSPQFAWEMRTGTRPSPQTAVPETACQT